jgi:putative two-component system response regulator
MIVDNDRASRDQLGQILSAHYHVVEAGSGELALDLVKHGPTPDLVLLTRRMPGIDGMAVLAAMRGRPQSAGIPVILISAEPSVEDETEGLRLGAQDYIIRPINPTIVLARVRTQIEAKIARDILTGQNAWLEREVARRMQDSRIIGASTIETLASLAEAHDADTALHVRRTQAYVGILVERLADHPRFREALADGRGALIVRAAPLHDIGKVAIPMSILTKPSHLSVEEFALVKTHTTVGAQAIDRAIENTLAIARADAPDEPVDESALAFLRVASEIACSHHERWDGTGYPRGLSGEEIPVSGRLMALADVFDALTSPRAYKPALSREQIEPILQRRSGTQFDPDVAAVYFADPEAFHAVAMRLADPGGPDATQEPSVD